MDEMKQRMQRMSQNYKRGLTFLDSSDDDWAGLESEEEFAKEANESKSQLANRMVVALKGLLSNRIEKEI